MLEQVGDWFRKLSFIVIVVGLLVAFWTEALIDIPVGKFNHRKPPAYVQRLEYGLLLASGIPGAAWAVARTVRGRQRTFWE
jgi:hypothetical protein